jgi:hypothetical protein
VKRKLVLVRKRLVTWAVVVLGAIVILVGSRWLLGPGDWAGLGQWVGGLGAFAAAWAALRIANGEVRRERVRDAERLRVHAHYVSGRVIQVDTLTRNYLAAEVRNRGTEPVLNVELVEIHVGTPEPSQAVRIKVDKGKFPVLIPGETWRPIWAMDPDDSRTALFGQFAQAGDEVEITFEDLGGTRWRRVGSQPPVLDGEAVSLPGAAG